MVDRDRNAGVDRHGIPSDECGEYYGLCASVVQLLYRTAIRDGDPGHAVEAGNALGRISRPARRNNVLHRNVCLGVQDPRSPALHRHERGCKANGGEPVPSALELDYLRGGYGGGKPDDEARANGTAFRAGVWCDPSSGRWIDDVLAEANLLA